MLYLNYSGRDKIRNTEGFVSSLEVITCLPMHSDGNTNHERLPDITNGNGNIALANNKVNERNIKDITSIPIEEDNKKEHTYISSDSKRKIQGSNSEHKFQAKKPKIVLNINREILIKSGQLEDRNSSLKEASMNKSLDSKIFKIRKTFKAETRDNDTNDDLPILTSPRKSLKKSRGNNCTQRENNVFQVSDLKKEIQVENQNDLTTSSSLCSSVVPLKVEKRENSNDTPEQNGFQCNLKGQKEDKTISMIHNRAIEVVVDINHKTKENSYSVSTQCEMLPDILRQSSHIDCDNIRMDKSSSSSQNFDLMDTTNKVGMYVEENVFSKDSVTILPINNSIDNYTVEIDDKKPEEQTSDSISIKNCNMRMLDDSSPVPMIFQDQDTVAISGTLVVCTDNILQVQHKEQKVEARPTQKDSITSSKIECLTTSNTGSFNENRKQLASNDIWIQKYFFQKVLFWNPVWFDEYGKSVIQYDANLYCRRLIVC